MKKVDDIYIYNLLNTPASGSFLGFIPVRVTKVRSGLNGVLGPRAPVDAIDSGVQSNATGHWFIHVCVHDAGTWCKE